MPVDTDGNPPLTCSQLIQDQQADPELVALSHTSISQASITEEEAKGHPVYYFILKGLVF